ncbi:hypothetical protein QR78_26450 [Methylobacterium indicum]|uniref:Uncharacterized protein n=1 Tax=Methylobacterium indicum TaxID=1775910 RepID=A0ABR5HGU6_9HYPH|nr:hypothetical protein QR78_26450 [Methylobacterium indicum]KMO25777.1 hypothetical protein QR79_05940 [Methylobacterium indicum]
MTTAPLPHVQASITIWLAAYVAAGTFYVLRGLGAEGARSRQGEWSGLALVALCWLPITVGNLVTLHRTRSIPAVLARFSVETVPPLVLLLAIVAVGTSP